MNPGDRHQALASAKLYGILDLGYVPPDHLLPAAAELLEGGVQILQLRAKKHSPSAIAAWGLDLLPLCHAAGVPFIINDYPEVARDLGADGVHIGQDDLSVEAVRNLVGPEVLIGLSTHSRAQLEAAHAKTLTAAAPDYLGFGPLFATPTKPDYQPVGVADLPLLPSKTHLPVFCIGGIKADNLPAVLQAGAQRVVIVSDLLTAPNRTRQTRLCRNILASSATTCPPA
jgi:thiamine-phosphate pyrophosphorylase